MRHGVTRHARAARARTFAAAWTLVAAAATATCAHARTARSRPVPGVVAGEFDPFGLLLERRGELALSDAQVDVLREQRGLLRTATRPYLARLDSVNATVQGRLSDWLAIAHGERLPGRGRGRSPTLPPEAQTAVARLLACVRANTGPAQRDMAALLLTPQQRVVLARVAPSVARAAEYGPEYGWGTGGDAAACATSGGASRDRTA